MSKIKSVTVIGTPHCPVCIRLKPEIQKFCVDRDIPHRDMMLSEALTEEKIVDILNLSHVSRAPAILIELEGTTKVFTGDNIYTDLVGISTSNYVSDI